MIDKSEITKPLDLRAFPPLSPRDEFRRRMEAERDMWLLLASEATQAILCTEYQGYADHCQAMVDHVDRWDEWHLDELCKSIDREFDHIAGASSHG